MDIQKLPEENILPDMCGFKGTLHLRFNTDLAVLIRPVFVVQFFITLVIFVQVYDDTSAKQRVEELMVLRIKLSNCKDFSGDKNTEDEYY